MTLFERIDAWQRRKKPQGSQSGHASAQRVVGQWRKAVVGGNSELFAERLGWDGLDQEAVTTALSWAESEPGSVAAFGPNPGWFGDLQASFRLGISLLDRGSSRRFLDEIDDLEIPFAELWIPWIAEAMESVSGHASIAEGRVSRSAVECLGRHLLRQLGELGAQGAFSQFNRRRSEVLSALDDRSGDRVYRRWVQEQIEHGLTALFEEFPVLARQMHRLLETWKTSTVELFDRLDADRSALSTMLCRFEDLGPLVAVRPGLSDRHHGGRRVAFLVFEGGRSIVYKPRSLEMEQAFAAFLGWLGTEGLEPVPRCPEVLQRQGYGWMEAVQPTQTMNSRDVSRWFSNAGVLLCVAYILGASDLHVDNVLAGEMSPALVDLETILHPEIGERGGEFGTAAGKVFERVRSSFLTTGMLTFLQEGRSGEVIDIGGLCGTGGHSLGPDTVTWRGLGSDGLHPVNRPGQSRERHNLPRINGEPQSAGSYSAEIQEGFSRAYRLLLARRSSLEDPQGTAKWFGELKSRVVLRPTESYARLLQLCFRSAYQRDGATAGVLIEALNRSLVKSGPRPLQWDLVEWEREVLEALDIPHLTASVEASTLEGPDNLPIEGVIAASGLDAFERRLKGMSEQDLEHQLHLMAMSLDARDSEVDHVFEESWGVDDLPRGAEDHRLSHDALFDVARSIADELVARAVEGEDGSLIWLDPVHLRPQGRRDRGVSYYLYSGSAGIALFLAAMADVLPDRSYREAAEGALLPIVDVFRDSQAKILLADEGLGACHGLGGIVYALSLSSVFLDQPEYIRTARQVVEHITEERIEADQTLDVEGGSAGAILGLLALQDLYPEDSALEAALACGRHLMAKQQPGLDGGAAWESRQGGMLAGFAHGASGVALALARLGRLVNDQTLFDAVERALEFENSLYDPEKKNWPLMLVDRQSGQQQRRTMSAWCHGAPGIALARSSMLDSMPQFAEDDMFCAALDTTLATPMEGPDHLCCGNLGRVEVLLKTGETLGHERLRRAAELRAAMVIQRVETSGAFRLTIGGGQPKAGFFRGLAGIGYQMLRLSRPDRVPSVLAFDPIGRRGGRE